MELTSQKLRKIAPGAGSFEIGEQDGSWRISKPQIMIESTFETVIRKRTSSDLVEEARQGAAEVVSSRYLYGISVMEKHRT